MNAARDPTTDVYQSHAELTARVSKLSACSIRPMELAQTSRRDRDAQTAKALGCRKLEVPAIGVEHILHDGEPQPRPLITLVEAHTTLDDP